MVTLKVVAGWMIRSLAQWIASCAIFIGFTFPSFADVSYAPKSGTRAPLITLSGQIEKDDLKHLVAFILMAREPE